MIVQVLSVGPLQTNCYIPYSPDTKEGIIIDPAAEPERIISEVRRLGLSIRFVINTHGHIDHVTANDAVREATRAPLLIHAADAHYLEHPDHVLARWLGSPAQLRAPDGKLADGDRLSFGPETLEVLHTPGHTPGGVSLYGEGVVFTGDALFYQGVGRTDLPGGNWNQLQASIQNRLFALPDDTIVYPGHGPSTTIGEERVGNPYV